MNVKSVLSKLLICLLIVLSFVLGVNYKNKTNEPVENKNIEITNVFHDEKNSIEQHEGYQLEKAVILSRHNIRSPLTDKDSMLKKVTNNEWFNWSSKSSELSIRGGNLETEMGQYFRRYFALEGLFEENIIPNDEEVRFYANSLQRTISTANFFKSGMFPLGNLEVEYHEEVGTMDPVFNPQLTYVSDKFIKEAIKEIGEMGGEDGINGIEEKLTENFAILEEVLDYKETEEYIKTNTNLLKTNDLEIVLEVNKEPAMKGSLKTANSIADAFTLQLYEERDLNKASFNHDLGESDWEKIGEIVDTYSDVLFTTKAISTNVAHPLLKEIKNELDNDDRKFSFLCGHDSNIASVTAALGVNDYKLDNAITKKAPIGSKLVFEIWHNELNEKYITISMVYQSVNQLRNLSPLDIDNPPCKYRLELEGLTSYGNNYYKYEDVINRFKDSIDAYEILK